MSWVVWRCWFKRPEHNPLQILIWFLLSYLFTTVNFLCYFWSSILAPVKFLLMKQFQHIENSAPSSSTTEVTLTSSYYTALGGGPKYHFFRTYHIYWLLWSMALNTQQLLISRHISTFTIFTTHVLSFFFNNVCIHSQFSEFSLTSQNSFILGRYLKTHTIQLKTKNTFLLQVCIQLNNWYFYNVLTT